MTKEPIPRLPTVMEKMGMPHTKAPPARLAPMERDSTVEAAAVRLTETRARQANKDARPEENKV